MPPPVAIFGLLACASARCVPCSFLCLCGIVSCMGSCCVRGLPVPRSRPTHRASAAGRAIALLTAAAHWGQARASPATSLAKQRHTSSLESAERLRRSGAARGYQTQTRPAHELAWPQPSHDQECRRENRGGTYSMRAMKARASASQTAHRQHEVAITNNQVLARASQNFLGEPVCKIRTPLLTFQRLRS